MSSGYCRRRSLGSQCPGRAAGDEHIDLEMDQFVAQRRQAVVLPFGPPVLDEKVFPLLVAEGAQSLAQGGMSGALRHVDANEPDPVHLPRLLRPSRNGPGDGSS